MADPVVVRFAPSPTGRMHIGGARTALYDYLLARQTGGRFILRFEDTDQKRFDPAAEEEIISGLHWLGLDWDEGPDKGGPNPPYRQSLAKDIHLDHTRRLVREEKAYPCFCTPERLAALREEQRKNKAQTRYDGTCRNLAAGDAARRVAAGESHVIRFKAPGEGATTVTDLLRGEIRVENTTLDDFILVKSDGLAVYHLAAMIDDHRMGVTHVIRGAEWLSTLPLHALILRAFGWAEPVWCHLSVFLKPSGKGKMSKRDGAELQPEGHSIFVGDLAGMGYIPEGIVNWIALMGASFDAAEDVFTMDDLVRRFSLDHLNPSPAAINFEKADHFNGMHIRRLTADDLAGRLAPFFAQAGCATDPEALRKVAAAVQVRIVTLDDAIAMAGFFFREKVAPDPKDLVGKGLTPRQSAEALAAARELIADRPGFDPAGIEAGLRALADRLHLKPGVLFGILRAAVTGQTVSPPLLASMEIIGRRKVLQRVIDAEERLQSLPDGFTSARQ
jgi:glutamyl-tRNA synthetase